MARIALSKFPNQVTRADLIKAFSFHGVPRDETLAVVSRYMGSAPVPPVWSRTSVEGTFGKRIAARWARRIQHRPAGCQRNAEGRVVRWISQTLHDFAPSFQERMANQVAPKEPVTRSKLLLVDEYWLLARGASNV